MTLLRQNLVSFTVVTKFTKRFDDKILGFRKFRKTAKSISSICLIQFKTEASLPVVPSETAP